MDFLTMIEFTQQVDPAVITSDVAAATGNSLAREDAVGLGFIVNVGESGDTLSGSVYLTVTLQESSDDSVFTDVADADCEIWVNGSKVSANGIVIDGAADDDAIITILYKGHAEYCAVELDLTGTHTNGIPVGVTGMRRMKVSQ